jgi:P27 family predicted phage terminase small subunit
LEKKLNSLVITRGDPLSLPDFFDKNNFYVKKCKWRIIMNAPEHFNETAIRYFDFIVEELTKIDKLNGTDEPIIGRLAYNLATVEECEKELMKDGFTVMGPHGKKEHPSVSTSMKAQSKVLEAFKSLGLDARTRLKIDKNEDNQSSDFLTSLVGGKF